MPFIGVFTKPTLVTILAILAGATLTVGVLVVTNNSIFNGCIRIAPDYNICDTASQLVIEPNSNIANIWLIKPNGTTGSANTTQIQFWQNDITSEPASGVLSISCSATSCSINSQARHTGNPNQFFIQWNGTQNTMTQTAAGGVSFQPQSGNFFQVNTTGGASARPSGKFIYNEPSIGNALRSEEGIQTTLQVNAAVGTGDGEDALLKAPNFVTAVISGYDFALTQISPILSIWELNSATGNINIGIHTGNGTIVTKDGASWCDDANSGDQVGNNIKCKDLDVLQHNNSTGWSFSNGGTSNILVINQTGNSFKGPLALSANATRAPLNFGSGIGTPTNKKNFDAWMDNTSFHTSSGGGTVLNYPAANCSFATCGIGFTTSQSFTALQAFHLSANYTQPANKTGTVSLSPVMLGANATFTPRYSSNATITVTATVTDSIGSDGCRVAIQKYTGTSFGNGRTVVAGNEKGSNLRIITPAAASSTTPFTLIYEDQALTGGTKYFYDLDFAAITAGTCTINNVSWDILEHLQ